MEKIGKVVIVEKVRDNSDKIVSGVITAAGAFLVFKGIRKLLKNKKCEIVEKAPEELQEEFEKFAPTMRTRRSLPSTTSPRTSPRRASPAAPSLAASCLS